RRLPRLLLRRDNNTSDSHGDSPLVELHETANMAVKAKNNLHWLKSSWLFVKIQVFKGRLACQSRSHSLSKGLKRGKKKKNRWQPMIRAASGKQL
ncbi:MAG: hypothetical protein WA054_00025, partial [Candidatus Moraniibacteriota bacterium]